MHEIPRKFVEKLKLTIQSNQIAVLIIFPLQPSRLFHRVISDSISAIGRDLSIFWDFVYIKASRCKF